MIADNQYLETKVMTATPWQLHLMVVEAAIRKATKAQHALEQRDFETSHFTLNDCRDCVTELVCGLNGEQQPDLVEKLRALFAFVYRNLAEADLHHDPNRVADALRVLKLHRETWIALGEQLRQENGNLGSPPSQIQQSWET